MLMNDSLENKSFGENQDSGKRKISFMDDKYIMSLEYRSFEVDPNSSEREKERGAIRFIEEFLIPQFDEKSNGGEYNAIYIYVYEDDKLPYGVNFEMVEVAKKVSPFYNIKAEKVITGNRRGYRFRRTYDW